MPWSEASTYLFNHTALAKVFLAKILAGIQQAGLNLTEYSPEKWVVDVKNVGTGQKAIVYLGRSVPGRDPGKRHPRLRQRPGHLPLSGQQNQKDRTQYRQRRGIPAPDHATHPAQRLAPCAQLWVFTSQQQKDDSAGAAIDQADPQTCCSATQQTPHTMLSLLWR